MHHKREIHGHRVITLVDHGFSKIERGDACVLEPLIIKQRFVHAGLVAKRQRQHIGKAGLDVIGVQNSIFRRLTDAIGPVGQHVGQRPHEHAHLALERRHAAERFQALASLLGVFHQHGFLANHAHERHWREGRQALGQHHRTRTGTAATVRGREGFVQVDVHRVDTKIAGAHFARDGVVVRAVAIKIAARIVHRLGNLDDLFFKDTAGVGVGQHDGGHIRPQQFFDLADTDGAINIGRDFLDGEANERRRCGVGAVGSGWNQHHRAGFGFALGGNGGFDRHHAAEFTVGTRLG